MIGGVLLTIRGNPLKIQGAGLLRCQGTYLGQVQTRLLAEPFLDICNFKYVCLRIGIRNGAQYVRWVVFDVKSQKLNLPRTADLTKYCYSTLRGLIGLRFQQ